MDIKLGGWIHDLATTVNSTFINSKSGAMNGVVTFEWSQNDWVLVVAGCFTCQIDVICSWTKVRRGFPFDFSPTKRSFPGSDKQLLTLMATLSAALTLKGAPDLETQGCGFVS